MTNNVGLWPNCNTAPTTLRPYGFAVHIFGFCVRRGAASWTGHRTSYHGHDDTQRHAHGGGGKFRTLARRRHGGTCLGSALCIHCLYGRQSAAAVSAVRSMASAVPTTPCLSESPLSQHSHALEHAAASAALHS